MINWLKQMFQTFHSKNIQTFGRVFMAEEHVLKIHRNMLCCTVTQDSSHFMSSIFPFPFYSSMAIEQTLSHDRIRVNICLANLGNAIYSNGQRHLMSNILKLIIIEEITCSKSSQNMISSLSALEIVLYKIIKNQVQQA